MSNVQFAQSFLPSSATSGSGWVQKLIDAQAEPKAKPEPMTVRGPLPTVPRSLLWAENWKGRMGGREWRAGKR